MTESDWIARWNQRYQAPDYAYGRQPNEFLVQQHRRIPAGEVLCVADGEGRNSVWLARQGYAVTALDYSRAGLEKTRRLAAEFGVEITLVEADLLTVQLERERYTGIVSIYAHFQSAVLPALHRKYIRALQNGGVFLAEVFSSRQLGRTSGGPRDLGMLYTVQNFEREFEGFDTQILREELVHLDEGPLHQGEAAVIRALLRKPPEKTGAGAGTSRKSVLRKQTR